MGDRMMSTTTATTKICPVEPCARRIAERQIMCPEHWNEVPPVERARVREHKARPGSPGYVSAATGAVRAVKAILEAQRAGRS